MKVRLLGYSSFMSKKGSQCLVVGYAFPDGRWKGLKVEQKFVNPDVVDGILKPGEDIEVDFDSSGYIVALHA